jgi:Na+:H+ antiporter, NhaC family
MPNESAKSPQPSTLFHALIPICALILFIGGNAAIHGESEWAPHIPLVLAAAIAALVGIVIGVSWKDIETGIVDGISVGMRAILILCVIGIMIGTWIASGIVPVMIYYGLQFMSPSFFLVASCLICSIVSLATGSSWTTAGTVGVALIGVGKGLGVPLPMVAGAIISGAYFGDKMSPLSDSTNLAPAVAGSELFEHIRHMLYTTAPALIIALILYAILGLRGFEGESSSDSINTILTTLNDSFNLSPLLLLPPGLIVLMVIFRLHALPALLGAALIGALLAITFQKVSPMEMVDIAQGGYTATTGNEMVDELLSRGGLDSMMYTVSLVLCALTFGGIMERCGFLKAIANAILKLARSTGSLVTATVATCFGMNIVAPDQYLSIIVPGRMYRDAYKERGLHAKNLSRTLEDAGTLSSPLVAWNTCGAYMATTLTVAPLAYLPYCFLNLLTPVIAIALAYLGWTIVKCPAPPSRS